MFCHKCGQEIKPGQKFCQKCGTDVTSHSYEGGAVKQATQLGKPNQGLLIGLSCLVIAVVLFVISIPVYNSLNSPEKLVDRLVSATKNKDASAESKILEYNDGTPLSQDALDTFNQYYSQHANELKSALKDIRIASSSNNFAIDESSFIGYKNYKIDVPVTTIKATILKGAILKIGAGKTPIPGTGSSQNIGKFVSTVPVHFVLAYKGNWGDVSEAKDLLPVSTMTFDFSNQYYYTINTYGIADGLPILIGGKDSGHKTGENDQQTVLGPIPTDKDIKFSVVTQEAFGSFTLSGSSKDSESKANFIDLRPDPTANKEIFSAIAKDLDGFMTSYSNKQLSFKTYLFPGSPMDQEFSATEFIDDPGKLTKLTVYSNSATKSTSTGITMINLDTQASIKYPDNTVSDVKIQQDSFAYDESSKQWKLYNRGTAVGSLNSSPSEQDIVISH